MWAIILMVKNSSSFKSIKDNEDTNEFPYTISVVQLTLVLWINNITFGNPDDWASVFLYAYGL